MIHGPDGPLISVYEEKLSTLIGVLSAFIVEKKYSETMNGGRERLDLDSALEMSKGILDDVSLLVGPVRAHQLSMEFERITEEYFKEAE
jgi:hypothetical protein